MIKNILWAGTEESAADCYNFMVASHKKLEELGHKLYSDDDDDERDDNPVGYQVKDGVGIISISGPTYTESNWITRMFGVATYPDIKERLAEAADDHDVKRIMLYINSPGGQAEGVSALSRFISTVDRLKPVTSFAAGTMASAAMWYGSAAREVIADEDSRLGSIGAIMIHFDYSENLKERGIKPTVFRSAPYKALGQPVEKLTEKAEQHIMKGIKALHDKFVVNISNNLKLDRAFVAKEIATGEVFEAPKAVELGLAGKIASFDETVARLVKMADNSTSQTGARSPANLEDNSDMSKKKLVISEALLAAASLGANVDTEVGENAETTGLTDKTGTVDSEAEPAANAVGADGGEGNGTEVKGTTDLTAAKDQENPLLKHLKDENASLQAKNAELMQQVSASEARLKTLEAEATALTKIVQLNVKRMTIALGGKPVGVDALSGVPLADMFNSLNAEFEKNFAVGGKARTASAEEGRHAESGSAAVVSLKGVNATKLS